MGELVMDEEIPAWVYKRWPDIAPLLGVPLTYFGTDYCAFFLDGHAFYASQANSWNQETCLKQIEAVNRKPPDNEPVDEVTIQVVDSLTFKGFWLRSTDDGFIHLQVGTRHNHGEPRFCFEEQKRDGDGMRLTYDAAREAKRLEAKREIEREERQAREEAEKAERERVRHAEKAKKMDSNPNWGSW